MIIKPITLDEVITFRKKFFTKPELIQDKWDKISTHIGVEKNDIIIASLRWTKAYKKSLPFKDHTSEIIVQNGDLEISRLLIDPEYRKSNAINYLILFLKDTFEYKKRIYIDVITENGIKINNYIKLGFKNTGYSYFDKRYNSESLILIREQI